MPSCLVCGKDLLKSGFSKNQLQRARKDGTAPTCKLCREGFGAFTCLSDEDEEEKQMAADCNMEELLLLEEREKERQRIRKEEEAKRKEEEKKKRAQLKEEVAKKREAEEQAILLQEQEKAAEKKRRKELARQQAIREKCEYHENPGNQQNEELATEHEVDWQRTQRNAQGAKKKKGYDRERRESEDSLDGGEPNTVTQNSRLASAPCETEELSADVFRDSRSLEKDNDVTRVDNHISLSNNSAEQEWQMAKGIASKRQQQHKHGNAALSDSVAKASKIESEQHNAQKHVRDAPQQTAKSHGAITHVLEGDRGAGDELHVEDLQHTNVCPRDEGILADPLLCRTLAPYSVISEGYLTVAANEMVMVQFCQGADKWETGGWCYGYVSGSTERRGWFPQRLVSQSLQKYASTQLMWH